jgi:S-adenosylmethionine:diacylglycerol 3-amino-3-carboxypropyl transferase
MRILLLMLCLMLTLSPVSACPLSEAPRTLDVRSVLTSNQFDMVLEQLRAAQPHTDYYLILRFEIEVMRRENPEYSDLLDRYLERLLQSEN